MSKVIDAKLKLKAIFSCPIRGMHYPCIVYKDVQWKFFLLKILCKCPHRFKASKIKFHEINWLQQRERKMSDCILPGLIILIASSTGNFWIRCVQFPNIITLTLLGCNIFSFFCQLVLEFGYCLTTSLFFCFFVLHDLWIWQVLSQRMSDFPKLFLFENTETAKNNNNYCYCNVVPRLLLWLFKLCPNQLATVDATHYFQPRAG